MILDRPHRKILEYPDILTYFTHCRPGASTPSITNLFFREPYASILCFITTTDQYPLFHDLWMADAATVT